MEQKKKPSRRRSHVIYIRFTEEEKAHVIKNAEKFDMNVNTYARCVLLTERQDRQRKSLKKAFTKRRYSIYLRVTEEEKQQIVNAAKEYGMRTAKYARYILLLEKE